MFVPSYGSVSSICIDNAITCLKAISILFDKFHVINENLQLKLYNKFKNIQKRAVTKKVG